MGYRSDVAFCLSVDQYRVEGGEWKYDKDKFKEMVGFFKLTKFYEEATAPEYDCVKSNNLGWQKGEIMFYAEQWKWYPDYSIVQAFNEMWKQMQDIEGISGYVMRVGEGDGNDPDVEDDEFGDAPNYDYFGSSTSMYLNDDETLGRTETDEAETTQESTATTQPDCAGANHATETQ
jgi:hypothetical protein